jgi:polysaccharide biosynthesis acetyltransferase WcbI-like protein
MLKTADCFIYQPLSNRYGVYSSDTLLPLLPKTCKVFSFPYIYNDALWPFAPSGDGLKGGDVLIKLINGGYDMDGIIDAFCHREIDCEFGRRFDISMRILKEKEAHTNIKISDYILENLSIKKLFLTQSHPTAPVLIHCANQILNGLGYSERRPHQQVLFDQAKYQDLLPVSPYESAHYGFEYAHEPDSNWKPFYSSEIEKFIKSLNYRE